MSDLISRRAMLKRLQAWSGNDVMDKALYNFTFNRIMEQPTIEAVPVVHGRWMLEAHKENVNYRWNVTAECSECCDGQNEIWAGFFPGVPDYFAESISLQCAENVKLSNYCPNCGADMRKGGAE